MNRNDYLAAKVLGHTQNIDGGHLILHAHRVLSEGTKGHINIVILAVLCKVDRKMRVAGVVNISSRSLYQIVHGLVIHIRRTYSRKLFSVFACIIRGYNAGTVKAVQRYNLQILDLNDVTGLYGNAPGFRNAPFHPGLHGLFRSDKGNRNLFSALIRSCHAALDYMRGPFRRHMILMVVGGQHRIHMLKCKRVDYKRHVSQIGLHQTASAHVSHLVSRLHLIVAMGSFSVSAPQIDGNIGVIRGLKPDAGTS